MKFYEFYRLLENDGWFIKTTNKHIKCVHPWKPGIIPVGKHGSKEVPTGT